MFKTPILFLIWNRPETTQIVFNRIKELKPENLYIAADGPRKDKVGDKKLCYETRKIVEKINWKCNVRKLYRRENLGLKKSVTDSISWFFDNNKEGIILEDDCLPDLSFFTFSALMLARYRNNKTVMHISGDNFQPEEKWNSNKYYFSKYPHIWGWATWRRAWKTYDSDLKIWPNISSSKKLDLLGNNFWERWYWKTIFEAVYRNDIKTWDYQWVFNIWRNNGVSVNPGINLVSNIGFGAGATNTVSTGSKLSALKVQTVSPNLKTMPIAINKEFDNFTSKNVFGINPLKVILRDMYYRFNLKKLI